MNGARDVGGAVLVGGQCASSRPARRVRVVVFEQRAPRRRRWCACAAVARRGRWWSRRGVHLEETQRLAGSRAFSCSSDSCFTSQYTLPATAGSAAARQWQLAKAPGGVVVESAMVYVGVLSQVGLSERRKIEAFGGNWTAPRKSSLFRAITNRFVPFTLMRRLLSLAF